MDQQTIFDLADQLKVLRDDKAKLEERLKHINAVIDEVDYKLTEAMAATETQNFTRAGTTFYLTSKVRASAVAGGQRELYDALRANGHGSLVYETVNANSLSAFVKEQISEYGDKHGGDGRLPGWLTGLVNVFEKTTVGVRKAK